MVANTRIVRNPFDGGMTIPYDHTLYTVLNVAHTSFLFNS
jgi:hypothetical protein